MENDAKIDVLQNGGSIASMLLQNKFDVNTLRPFVDEGGSFVNNADGSARMVSNAATLRKDEWIHLDRSVTQVARARLRFVQDLKDMGLVYNLPNAMGITKLDYQNMSDINAATISMSPVNKSVSDRPVFDLTSLPIPIIHKDFYYDVREIATSRNMGTPLDTTAAILAGRKVAEAVEQLHVGTYGTYKFSGGNIYGLRNFPSRTQTTYSDWTASAKTGPERLDDVLGFLTMLRNNYQYGPYGFYLGKNLERYLDEDYTTNYAITLRERLLKVGKESEGGTGSVKFVRALDDLSDDDIIVVDLKQETIDTVDGMAPTVIQWTTDGGTLFHFKVMAIQVPRPRTDYNSKCGILHATKA